MPSRNVIKQDAPHSFYHVYARGSNRQRIFRDATDYEKFLKLFARYLSLEEARNSIGISFPNFYNKLDLLAFCLMPNHFHLLVYQYQQKAMTEFMRSLLTSYSMYFNKKYKRSGPLFESRFKASLISDDAYLEHISRHIHMNPRNWRTYEYSSLPYYLQQITDTWLRPERITNLFSGPTKYIKFLEDYQQNKEMMDILKHELADFK
ncbi:MAG TPA: transposase [Candidatus Saccharimonadales bacterium]|nr:transposase [Candidatus Saccharimonadales bacterium]